LNFHFLQLGTFMKHGEYGPWSQLYDLRLQIEVQAFLTARC
jgi:hypothetical protein